MGGLKGDLKEKRVKAEDDGCVKNSVRRKGEGEKKPMYHYI